MSEPVDETADDAEAIRALGERLIRGWPLGTHEVTDELRALATAEEPARARVLADLALLVRLPRPVGLGLEVTLAAPVQIEVIGGRREAREVRLRAAYATDMSGRELDAITRTIPRVVHEPAGWRIHALFEDHDRPQLEAFVALLRERRT